MEKVEIKIGDIVKAKYGVAVFGGEKADGTSGHTNFDIYGVVTDLTLNEQAQIQEVEMKFFFDAVSSHKYKPDELEIIYSTNLIKAPVKPTPELIRTEFMGNDNCMSEYLATVPADGLTLEEAFELYIGARRWADKDRFFVDKDEDEMEELEF